MDDYNISMLSEAKSEYSIRLLNIYLRDPFLKYIGIIG